MTELFNVLFKPFSDKVKQTKKQAGQEITFVSWIHYVVRAWHQFPQGYSKDVRVNEVGGQLVVTVRITDRASGCYQEALGAAPADKTSWGGAMAEAESQAFRRAMANFGLGLEMYMDEDEFNRTQRALAAKGSGDDSAAPAPEDPEAPETPSASPEPDVPATKPAPKAASDRQMEVLKVLGQGLSALGEDDEEIKLFVNKQRGKLTQPITHGKAGAVIAAFRAKYAELGYDDPTKSDVAA